MTLCECGCGKEAKAGSTFLQGHYSRWLKGQKEITEEALSDSTRTPEKEKLPSVIKRFDGWLKQKLKKKSKEKLLTTSEIREMQIKQETESSLTCEQKYKRFFGNLKKWKDNKPGAFALWRMKRRYPDAIIKHVVFMDEDGDDYKQAYIYYNRELGYLQTDDAFYDIPLKDTKTIFLDSKRFTPLVNRKNYRDDYDIPEDFAESLVSTGIFYARLTQLKDLMAEIKQMKIVSILAIVGFILILIILFLTTYNANKTIKMMAENIGNMTEAIKTLKS